MGTTSITRRATLALTALASLAMVACVPPTPPSNQAKCGSSAAPPATYEHVVVVVEENRTWDNVGGVGFADPYMPFLHDLGVNCTVFADWAETNLAQNSLTQYVGLTSGANNTSTVNDCEPSVTCRSLDDNIFRQVRRAGGTARNFVDGATTGCSVGSNAAKHIPALYYFGTYTDGTGTHNDHDFCNDEVRPLSELDPDHLPTFAMITPDLCHDGHDCLNASVDEWAASTLQPILDGAEYQAGTTAVIVNYDEDRPVPNLLVAPTANRGINTTPGAGHAAMLRTWDEMLGLPIIAQPSVTGAISLRGPAHI